MGRNVYAPTVGSPYFAGVMPVAQGGTGAQTKEQAASTLGFIPAAQKGVAGGVAVLDENNEVALSSLPQAVRDVASGTPSTPSGNMSSGFAYFIGAQ